MATPASVRAATQDLLARKRGAVVVEAPPVLQEDFLTEDMVIAPPRVEVQVVEDVREDDDDDDDDEPSFGAPDLSGALEEACVALGYGDPARRAELMDALTNGVPDDVVAQVVATRGGDRGHVAQELARQAGPFREALKRVAVATRLGHKIDKDRDSEAGGDDLTDEDIVQRLREMGPCPMGFAWHREGSGWRCGGGSHFVHDDDPMLQA